MNNPGHEHLTKKIKKNLYGKPQIMQALYPAGMGETALTEIQDILNNLWFKQKYISELSLAKNKIRIAPIHLFAVTELLMRTQSLSDIRLIIYEGIASGKEIFRKKCLSIPWHFYLDKKMSLKIKVNSVASRAFHESGLKEIISEILENNVDHIVSGENTDETTSLYVDLYKNKLTISISLAGEPLYKRGFRHILSASAPLREDIAFCCLERALKFAKQSDNSYVPETFLIPFSGTGTFLFEYIQRIFKFSPILFSRNYALTKMPFYKPEHFNFLVKKAKEYVLPSNELLQCICIDYSNNAMAVLSENLKAFKKFFEEQNLFFPEKFFKLCEEDFFKMDFSNLAGNNIFMPLNPPYGIRLGNKNTIELYKKIANKINDLISIIKNSEKRLLGFILCPDENSWSHFMNTLKNMETETYHITQGGLDIRICQFYSMR